ncbi:MAG: c-type cytochrome [Pseudomonadota bacterium]
MQVRKFISRSVLGCLVATFATLAASATWAAGDPQAGEAQSAACAACHGQDGATPLTPEYPNLAGQNEKYLMRQLQMIQSDERQIPLMAGQLNGKSEQDLADLAAYYASLPAKIGQAQGDDEQIALAEQIFKGGIARKNVAACAACHSPTGMGNAQAGFPRVGGQPVAYTIAQLTAYREKTRATDELFGGMMRDTAEGLTDTEIALLADYLQGIH